MLQPPRKPNNLLTGRLDGQLSRFLLRGRHGLIASGVGGVVAPGLRSGCGDHAHGARRADVGVRARGARLAARAPGIRREA